MRLKVHGIVIMALLAFCLHRPSTVYAIEMEELQLKALFVLNFAKLTEWPASDYSDDGTFTIAILGKKPPAAFINVLKAQTVRGAKVTIVYVDSVQEAKGSRLLYISDSERQRLPGIMKSLHELPTLTVSDMAGFSQEGGMIGMVPVNNRLTFDVNMAAVRKARLSVSSQLLKLARVLYGQ